MVIEHPVFGPTFALKPISLLSYHVNALGSNQIYAAFFATFYRETPDLRSRGRCRTACIWYTGSQELVPWKWETLHQHTAQEGTHTNQNDRETTSCWSQQSHELTLLADSLDSPFLLKNDDTTPILPLSIGRACTNVAHTQGVSGASSRLMPGLLTQQF